MKTDNLPTVHGSTTLETIYLPWDPGQSAVGKTYFTPGRRWAGFSMDEPPDMAVDPNIRYALIDMYTVFDRVGDGIDAIMEVTDEGGLRIMFDYRTIEFLNARRVSIEGWLDEAYNVVIGYDMFVGLDWDGKSLDRNSTDDCVLLDTNGKMTYEVK